MITYNAFPAFALPNIEFIDTRTLRRKKLCEHKTVRFAATTSN